MRYGKILSFAIIMISLISGCANVKNGDTVKDSRQKEIYEESEELAEGYRYIYEKAETQQKIDSLETQQKIIEYMGKEGYAAVDMENQIDMVNPEQVEQFCAQVENKKKGEVTILSVIYGGGFARYNLQTNHGKIDVEVSYLEWEDARPVADHFREFEAYTWKYTENGYFFIEEYHMPGYDGAPGQTGFRVKPLKQICREWNRKYVMPIGYERNNFLITEWNKANYAGLDFYDLYERMYPMKYGSNVPYDAAFGGMEYAIPRTEFEEVLQTYLQADHAVIAENADYREESQTYRYRPRGLYDSEHPYGPYPEVVDYEELDDGTIKLTINAVWVREMQDAAFSSELVIEPMENGKFRYVSNHILPSDSDSGAKWYNERLKEDEWEEHYGEK